MQRNVILSVKLGADGQGKVPNGGESKIMRGAK